MTEVQNMADDLATRLTLCQELLQGVEREGATLRQPNQSSLFEFYQLRKTLLPSLLRSLEDLRRHRAHWQQLSREERSRYPEIDELVQQNQDVTMKIILLDRENEQNMLRRGMLPAQNLPSPQRQRPHFVADLYRRQSPA